MFVFSFGKVPTIQRKPCFYDLGADVATVRQVSGSDQAIIRRFTCQFDANDPSLTKINHFPFGFLPPRLIKFWCVNPCKPNFNFANDNRVAVYHPCLALKLT